jgi:hypothetical protein
MTTLQLATTQAGRRRSLAHCLLLAGVHLRRRTQRWTDPPPLRCSLSYAPSMMAR